MEEIIVVIICLGLNALFAAYEMAFISVPRPELRNLARQGNKAAQKLLSLRENPERALSVIQIGITLVSAVAAALGGSGASETIEPYLQQRYGLRELNAEIISVVLVVIPITYLSVVVGELVPKTLALRNPLKIVLKGAGALFIADRVLSPVITVLEWSTKGILKTFFKRTISPEAPQTTIDIESFSPVHQSFIMNMIEIKKNKIKNILIPWSQVNLVKSSDQTDEVAQVVMASGHTRLPVIDNDLVIGILHTKEFAALQASGENNWQAIIRPALKVQSSDSAFGVLRLMQEKHNHMTIVYSPTGERLGICTMEDIIEEIVGDIYDEDDDGKVRKVFATKARARIIREENEK